jgi:hypothetical protein
MNETLRASVSAFLKLVVLAACVYIWVFYLRLGWFLPVAWLAGCAIAVYVTGSERRRVRPGVLGATVVVLVYTGVQLIVLLAATTQAEQTLPMRWSVSESERGPEVALEFGKHPGHFVGLYSVDLATYLASRQGDEVEAVFVVSKALGCMRGFHTERVGELTDWEADADGYARATVPTDGPWTDPPWCP